MSRNCPNYVTCRLVNTNVVERDKAKKEHYITLYCLREETWRTCRRYTSRRALWISPDFILPDSNLTDDEIIDRYEKEIQ